MIDPEIYEVTTGIKVSMLDIKTGRFMERSNEQLQRMVKKTINQLSIRGKGY